MHMGVNPEIRGIMPQDEATKEIVSELKRRLHQLFREIGFNGYVDIDDQNQANRSIVIVKIQPGNSPVEVLVFKSDSDIDQFIEEARAIMNGVRK